MSRIKGRDTQPEILVRKFLFSNGYRYRLHNRKLPGRPDIVLAKYKTIIFIHGCFWHGHPGCRYFVIPKTRTDWWLSKIQSNKIRDDKSFKALRAGSWKVITIWECELKTGKRKQTFKKLLSKIERYANSRD